MTSHRIAGGGGVTLHVIENGNPLGRPVLFIHGFSQCSLAWSRQLESPLSEACRLVAMDLRGHGQSGKPLDAYGDSRLWADDVHAVLRSLSLDRPILCGWSYGALVVLDYIRHYGQDGVGGVHFVGGLTRLGSPDALGMLTPALLELLPGCLSDDAETAVGALEGLIRLCLTHPPSPSELSLMLGYNVLVPPHVRRAMLARVIDNDDVLEALRIPVLITHGADERVMKATVIDHCRTKIPHAQVHFIPDTGHAPFWEDAAAFNRGLQTFARTVWRGEATTTLV